LDRSWSVLEMTDFVEMIVGGFIVCRHDKEGLDGLVAFLSIFMLLMFCCGLVSEFIMNGSTICIGLYSTLGFRSNC
jgi:hypothetical protein